MAETQQALAAVVETLKKSLAEERRLYETARDEIAAATLRANAHAANIYSIEGTLEFFTKSTDEPYKREQPAVLQFTPRVEVEYRSERRPAPEPRLTKRGYIRDLAVAHPGLTTAELFKHVPADAPFEIDMADMHRNLSRLVYDGKLDRKGGKHYPPGGVIKESEATG